MTHSIPDSRPVAIAGHPEGPQDGAAERARFDTNFGEECVHLLAQSLFHDSEQHRERAAVKLSERGVLLDAVAAAFLSALELDPEIQRRSLEALAHLGSRAKRLVPAVARLLVSDVAEVRLMAAYAVVRLKGESRVALAELAVHLAHDEEWIRQYAAGLLGRLGPAATAARFALHDALEHPTSLTRQHAVRALAAIGIDALAPALRHRCEAVRHHAIFLLDRTAKGDPRALELLAEALDDPSLQVRRSAAFSLARNRPASSRLRTALERRLGDADLEVRGWCAVALAVVGGCTSVVVGELLEAIQAGPTQLRSLASRALALVAPSERGDCPAGAQGIA